MTDLSGIFDEQYLPKERKSEPGWHPAIKGSFLYISTAGVREPDVLVQEFYREIFFSKFSEYVTGTAEVSGKVSNSTSVNLSAQKKAKKAIKVGAIVEKKVGETKDGKDKFEALKPPTVINAINGTSLTLSVPQTIADKTLLKFATKIKELTAKPAYPSPGGDEFSLEEQAVLYALRGRRKERRKDDSKEKDFYTPAFPGLMRHSWLRSQTDKAIKNVLFCALSQKISGNSSRVEEKTDELVKNIYEALVGGNTIKMGSDRFDILSLGFDTLKGCRKEEESRNHFKDLLGKPITPPFKMGGGREDDPLACRIYDDFLALCSLEVGLDRLQWLGLLKTFLRLATSVWLLAHMKLTVLVKEALLDALEEGKGPHNDWPSAEIKDRYRGLLQPSVTETKLTDGLIDSYMKARVELNWLFAVVQKYSGAALEGKVITVTEGSASDLSLMQLIGIARKAHKKLVIDLNGSSLRSQLTRQCERHSAWMKPREYGQGKNYYEFLNVLRHMGSGYGDGGHLLEGKPKSGLKVFPGQLMIKLIAYLGGERVNKLGRQFVLGDLEEHFSQYGVDFGSSATGRPQLIKKMKEIGLLDGRPDGGASVAIKRPYPRRKKGQ